MYNPTLSITNRLDRSLDNRIYERSRWAKHRNSKINRRKFERKWRNLDSIWTEERLNFTIIAKNWLKRKIILKIKNNGNSLKQIKRFEQWKCLNLKIIQKESNNNSTICKRSQWKKEIAFKCKLLSNSHNVINALKLVLQNLIYINRNRKKKKVKAVSNNRWLCRLLS